MATTQSFILYRKKRLSVNLDGLSLFPFGVWVDDSSDDNNPVAEGHFNPHMHRQLDT